MYRGFDYLYSVYRKINIYFALVILVFTPIKNLHTQGMEVKNDFQFTVQNIVAENQEQFPVLKGEYFGQKKPGLKPENFAPFIYPFVHQMHSSPVFSPDGKEVYFSVFYNRQFSETILFMKQENGVWTPPKIASFSGRYFEGGPQFTPDGNKIFYGSNRTLRDDGKNKEDRDIWYVERTGDSWGKPQYFEYNTATWDQRMSFAVNGNMYFRSSNDIYLSKFINGKYSKPQRMDNSINTDKYTELGACIAWDESFLIFTSSRPSGYGPNDLYISFRNGDGTWTKAVNMGEDINWLEDGMIITRFPKLSPDGKYLFFTKGYRGRDIIYWVDAKIVERLKEGN